MRQDIIDYINTLGLGSFLVSNEVPWEDAGTNLWLKNPKVIYVDVANYTTEPIVTALNGLQIQNETTSVNAYFSCDAKQLPSNYDTLVSDLKLARDISAAEGFNRREVDVSTSMESDLLVTELEFRFTKITT
jgi:hypothetical protein